ncbi:hypothetical protein [Acetobacter sp. UBA5411]|uniref:hypothetical protein n=1 Tax=Acetobacter sp. UBA5411 TaxID=1945905 RepID=UPI0025BEBC9F|nr:hypothetical protein [Acetobacter sp. UBA5411]
MELAACLARDTAALPVMDTLHIPACGQLGLRRVVSYRLRHVPAFQRPSNASMNSLSEVLQEAEKFSTDLFDKMLKTMAQQSERQFGAFLMLYLLNFNEPYKENPKIRTFGNNTYIRERYHKMMNLLNSALGIR